MSCYTTASYFLLQNKRQKAIDKGLKHYFRDYHTYNFLSRGLIRSIIILNIEN